MSRYKMNKYTAQFEYTDDSGKTIKLLEVDIRATNRDVAFNLLDPLAEVMGKSVGEHVHIHIYDYEEED